MLELCQDNVARTTHILPRISTIYFNGHRRISTDRTRTTTIFSILPFHDTFRYVSVQWWSSLNCSVLQWGEQAFLLLSSTKCILQNIRNELASFIQTMVVRVQFRVYYTDCPLFPILLLGLLRCHFFRSSLEMRIYLRIYQVCGFAFPQRVWK